MSASPKPPASPSPSATAHAYASNGLEILQAASDAAQAVGLNHGHGAGDNTDVLHGLNGFDDLQHAVHGGNHEANNGQQADFDALQRAVHAVSNVQSKVDVDALQHAAAEAVAEQSATSHADDGAGSGEALQLAAMSGNNAMRDPMVNPKLTRLRRACDMCSARKVKCDDTDMPCRPCRELAVDCTYDRLTKRRGPPNKHAEAAKAVKRARIEPAGPAPAFLPPSPSPQTAAKTLLNLASEGTLDAETIAPMPVLELLVDDFFTYIHPLAPFPHEPTFRQSFANREDRTRPEFLGLLASMICALVASFPRSAREHLKAQHSTHLFPKAIVMIDKCQDIALLTRGTRWVLKQPKTLDDAATSYFLGLAAGYSHQWTSSRHFMAETLTLIRELGFSRPKHPGDLPTFGNDTYSPDPLPFNHVKDQIGKRIFWCLLLGVRSFSQLGASQTDIVIAPSTPNLPYPAYPENVDDNCVVANEIIHQPEGSVTLLTGFRFGIDIYTTMNGVVSLELAYGISTLPWTDQRILVRDGLLAAKSITDDLPPELQLGDESNPLAGLDEASVQYVPPAWPNAQPAHDLRNIIKSQPTRRRQLQYEIQKANIFVSQLATRSYFVELYFNLRDVHLAEQQNNPAAQQPSEDESAEDKDILAFMLAERELIVQNLLTVLGTISQRNLEPNGGSLINKIRSVASTLLNDAPDRKGPFAKQAEEALSQLIDVLVKLEKVGPGAGAVPGNETTARTQAQTQQDPNQMTAQDEEDELRHWADLREYQLRFSAHGGFAGHV